MGASLNAKDAVTNITQIGKEIHGAAPGACITPAIVCGALEVPKLTVADTYIKRIPRVSVDLGLHVYSYVFL